MMGVVSIPIPSFQLNQGEGASARADVTVAEAELDASRRLLAGQIAEARSGGRRGGSARAPTGREILPRFEEPHAAAPLVRAREIDILALSTGRNASCASRATRSARSRTTSSRWRTRAGRRRRPLAR